MTGPVGARYGEPISGSWAGGAPGATAPRGGERVGAIDGLRTLAVAAVVAYHLGHLPGGWVGVDLFFVLSGYLITSLLLAERRLDGRIHLPAFWGRRARRLLPAALACVAVTLAAGTVLEPDAVGAWARTGTASALWVANWQQVLAGGSYFDGFGPPNALKHLWSLSVEEQVYLLWPIVLAGAARLGRRRAVWCVAAVALALAAASAVAGLVLAPADGADTTRVWFGTDTRAVAPLVGAALAAVVAARGWPTSVAGRALASALGAVGLAVLAAIALSLEDRDPAIWRGGAVVAALASAAVVAAAARPGALQRALAASPAVTWVGRCLSYSLYLWHWPVIVLLTPARTGLDGAALDLVRVAVAVGLSGLSWRLLEHPLRAGAPRPRPRPGPRAVGLAVGAVTSVAAVGLVVSGAHPTRAGRMEALLTSAGADVVEATPAPARSARAGVDQPAATEPPTVSVYGDSVAWSFTVGATPDLLAELGVARLHNHAAWGCQLLVAPRRSGDRTDPADTSCPDWPAQWAASIDAERPDVAVLSVGPWEVFDRHLDGAWRPFGSPEHDTHLRAALDRALTVLGGRAAQVVVITAPYPERPDDGLSPAEWVGSPSSRARFDHLNDLLREAAARHGAAVVELDELWCPTPGECRAEPVRYDGLHFDPHTAAPPVLEFVLDRALPRDPPAAPGPVLGATTPRAR